MLLFVLDFAQRRKLPTKTMEELNVKTVLEHLLETAKTRSLRANQSKLSTPGLKTAVSPTQTAVRD